MKKPGWFQSMKAAGVLLFSVLFTLQAQADGSGNKRQAMELHSQYIEVYEAQDMDGLMALMAEGPLMIWGTGADEEAVDKPMLRKVISRDFSEAKVKANPSQVQAFVHGDSAIVVSHWSPAYQPTGSSDWFHMPTLRVTMGLEKHGDNYLIRHAHFSAPLSVQPADHSFIEQK